MAECINLYLSAVKNSALTPYTYTYTVNVLDRNRTSS